MRAKSVYPLSTAMLFASLSSVFADTIVLGADPWCPYNCDPTSDKPGFMVEVAQEALGLHGHEVTYVVVSWARGLWQADNGEINGVIGAVPDEAPGFIFGPPIGTYQDTVLVRRNERIDLESLQERSDLRIGAINGYEYFGPVSEYIERNEHNRSIVQFASGDDALFQNIRKLVAGRVDMVAEVRVVAEHALSELGIAGEVEVLPTDATDDIYIAFSPQLRSSEIYAQQLADGVAELRASGRYAEIFAKYGLEPN